MSRQKAGGREERKRERRLISNVDSSHLHGMGRGEVEEMWGEGGGREVGYRDGGKGGGGELGEGGRGGGEED